MRLNPRTGRPAQPTGLRFAKARLWWNIAHFFELRAARADFTHSWVDVHVEWLRELGVQREKVLGKGLVALEIGLLVALIVWPVLVRL